MTDQNAPFVPSTDPLVSNSARYRCLQDEAAARQAGFSPAAPLYAIGRRVNELGRKNFQASRQKFEDCPSVAEAADQVAAIIRAEAREDVVVPLSAVRLLDDGRIDVEGRALSLSEVGFDQLIARADGAPSGASRYLAGCPLSMRVDHARYWMRNATRTEPVVIRTRNAADGLDREAFAIVTPSYTRVDADKLAHAVAEVVAEDPEADGGRAQATYDGHRLSMRIVHHAVLNDVSDLAAGDFFKAAYGVTAMDDGRAAIHVRSELYRNLCLNLIVIDVATQELARVIHAGNGVHKRIREGLEKAKAQIRHFAKQWADTARVQAIDAGGNAEQVFVRLINRDLVKVPGVGAQDLLGVLVKAWEKEPLRTRSSIINAITRAAHESRWPSYQTEEELEAQAGKLIHAYVWERVAAVTEKEELKKVSRPIFKLDVAGLAPHAENLQMQTVRLFS